MDALRSFLADLAACLRFYSRLPIPVLPFEPAPHAMLDFGGAIRALPLAGAIIAAVGALVLALAALLGLPISICAALALAGLIATTGAFHEDGLADMADGFGGGRTRADKLEIMKDSRLGTYGTVALVLSLLIRWAALAALLDLSLLLASAVLIAVGALSRTLALIPLVLLPPARDEGAAWRAGKPQAKSLAIAGAQAALLSCLPALAGAAAPHCVLTMVVGGLAAWGVAVLSKRQIGGQTGDVGGAAQQAAEIAALCAFLIGVTI